MWLMTPFGFFSIVQKPDDEEKGTLTIRARVYQDLEKLRTKYLPGMGEISANAGSDYRYRAKAPRGEVGLALANMAVGIGYNNFKDEVAVRQGKVRAGLYGKVWEVLYKLPDEQPVNKKTQQAAVNTKKEALGLASAYGGVVVDAQGLILLREPRNHFDGYVWTFPKGRPDKGETPEEAALREVREETGYGARIIAKLEGSHIGGTTVTEYFMMAPVGHPSAFDSETAAIRWATPDEAKALISKTTNQKGRERDLAVLNAVMKRQRK